MNDILAFLDKWMGETPQDIAMAIANDLRKRRIEKNLTRAALARQAGISPSNLARFEQKGLISLQNLIALADALGYTAEIKGIFSEPKYQTMDELQQIRRNQNKKRAHTPVGLRLSLDQSSTMSKPTFLTSFVVPS